MNHGGGSKQQHLPSAELGAEILGAAAGDDDVEFIGVHPAAAAALVARAVHGC